MSGENTLIGLAIVCGAAVLLAPVGCTMHRQHLTEKAIAAGADPIAARCSLGGGENLSTPVCVLKAQEVKP